MAGAVAWLVYALAWPLPLTSAEALNPAVGAAKGPPVLEFSCVPASGLVDRFDTYTLTFKTQDTVPVAGAFRVTFPEGFDVSTAGASYSDIPRPDVPGVHTVQYDHQSIWIYLDSTGTPATPGTQLQLVLSDVYNPVTARAYSVALEVFDAGLSTLYGPTLSGPFHIWPGPPAQIDLAPPADTLTAGDTFEYSAAATDAYGNVIASAVPSYRVEPDSLGFFTDAIFSARKPGQGRVIVSLATLADTSGPLAVLPGPLVAWELAGVPATVVAGAAASLQPVTVTARDAFGNRQFLFAGDLYFDTRDVQASLPATPSSPYVMSSQDSGQAVFSGSGFIWRTAGVDSLTVEGGSVSQATPVTVTADVGFECQMSAPDTVTAGVPFTLTVFNMTDRFGNPAGGVLTPFTSQTDSAAPNGQVPSLPAVTAVAGQGTAQAVLYKAGEYPVFGRLGDSTRQTPSITIMPQAARSFAWTVSSPLVSGLPVDSPFSITALDPYRNVVRHYAQIGAPVTLSASTGDSLAPALLARTDFTAGVADLHARNFTYFGSGGGVAFSAIAGPATGSTALLEAQSLLAESLSVGESVRRRGVDTLTGRVRLSVLGNGPVTITGLDLNTSAGSQALTNVTPALPAHLTGPSVVDLDFRWPVPASLAEGPLSVSCRVLAQYPIGSVVRDAPDTATVSIVRASALSVVSLVPDTVAYDDVLYQAIVTNTGGAGVSFQLDSSFLTFAGGLRRDTARTQLPGVAYLGPHDTLQLEYATRHAIGFINDTARASWRVRGTELGHPVFYSLPAPRLVKFTMPASLSYITGSQSLDTLVVGVADTVRVRIRNTGTTIVRSTDAQLSWSDSTDTIRVSVARNLTPFADWLPGDTSLTFSVSKEQMQVKTGWYRTRVFVSGKHNRIDTLFATNVVDSVFVVNQPSLQVDTMWSSAPRSTQVSTGQTYTIFARVSNTGGDVLDSVRLALRSDGGSSLADTVSAPTTILTASSREFAWQVTAPADSVAQEVFRTETVSGLGRVTRQPVTVQGSDRNALAIQTQISSSVEVQARLFSPDEALDGRIAAGRSFEVAARFINLGEAATSGARLRIELSGGIALVPPAGPTQSPPVNVDAVWSLQAPNDDTTATLIVRLDTAVQELNTGESSYVAKGEDTIHVNIVFEAPPLRILNVQTQGGAVDAPYEPMSWTWANDDPTGLFPILVQNLAVEATSADGATTLNASSLVESAQLEMPTDTVSAVIDGEFLRFGTDSLARVNSGTQGQVRLRIVPRLSGSLAEFRWVTRAELWHAVERSVLGVGLIVPVLDERGLSLLIESDLAFVPGSQAANYPNPFKAGSEVTHIQYDLASSSQVNIDIYSVSGQEVWKFQAAAGTAGGHEGPNTVDWDGRNGKGDVVMDGVYLARLRTVDGESTIKIVVMK